MAEIRVRSNSTGKEFEEALALYYFGARYYDPQLGLWLVPDPAGQFFNPYSYGGDPLNFVDPDGLWSLGLGVVVGWNKRGGWHIGFGAAADFSEEIGFGGNVSHVWNEDGSTTSSVGAQAEFGVVNVGGGYSYNSTYGHSVHGTVGAFGANVNTSHYWTPGGDYVGGTLGVGYGWQGFGLDAGVGIEHGFGQFQGCLYATAGAFGFSGQYHTGNGWNTGFSGTIELANYDPEKGFGSPIYDLKKEIDKQHVLDNSTAALPLGLVAAAPVYTPYLASAATAIGGLIAGTAIGEWYINYKKGGQGKGERGRTARPDGTPNPYKHTRPHPTRPDKIIQRDPHTGKDVVKPKPPDYPKN